MLKLHTVYMLIFTAVMQNHGDSGISQHINKKNVGKIRILLFCFYAGDRTGAVLRGGVRRSTVVGRLSQQVHGFSRSTSVRSQAHIDYRSVQSIVRFLHLILDQELIPYRYSSCSACCSCSCWSDSKFRPSFQIGSGWNLARLFFKYTDRLTHALWSITSIINLCKCIFTSGRLNDCWCC